MIDRFIPRIDPQYWCVHQLGGGGDHDDVFYPYLSDDLRAELQVSASQDESLGPDGAEENLCLRVFLEETKDLLFIDIGANNLFLVDSINT